MTTLLDVKVEIKEFKPRKCCARRSQINHITKKAEAIYPHKSLLPLPDILDYRPQLRPIRDQGLEGSCVAHVGACIKEHQEAIDCQINEDFSPQFIYNLRQDPTTEGMDALNLFQILCLYGDCLEKNYPYGKIEDADKISDSVKEEAKNYVIRSYSLVSTIDGLKMGLYKNGLCMIIFPVYNLGTRMWKPEKPNQEPQGYHAMTVVGYNKDGFIIRNQWGFDWGDKGYTIYPYEDFGMHEEIWSCLDKTSTHPIPGRHIAGMVKPIITKIRQTEEATCGCFPWCKKKDKSI